MQIRNLTQKLEIAFVIKNEWHLPVHRHTHYELQYIMKGRGQHVINDQTYNYTRGDIFILPPQDSHFFIFQEKTTICIVKFHESFFDNFPYPQRTIMPTGKNNEQVISLMDLLIAEHRNKSAYQDIIIKNTLSLVLILMIKDGGQSPVKIHGEKIQVVLNYIDRHITDRQLLSIENISATFNVNKTYFSQYFSRKTGSTYKKYVQEYALGLIAHQLVNSNKTLSQLAHEFGYSDTSHLSNAFKARFDQTPSAFKKAKQV